MSQYSLDYDYPTASKKTNLQIRPSQFWYKNHQPIPPVRSSTPLSSLSTSKSSTNLSYDYNLNSSTTLKNVGGSSRNLLLRQNTDESDDYYPNYDTPRSMGMVRGESELGLDAKILLSNNREFVIGNGNGVYYDMPKNTPIKKSNEIIFETLPKAKKLQQPRQQQQQQKPAIPRKSSFVRRKISEYPTPLYQNMKKLDIDDDCSKVEVKPPAIQTTSPNQMMPLLNRQTTSKQLPKLLNEPKYSESKSTTLPPLPPPKLMGTAKLLAQEQEQQKQNHIMEYISNYRPPPPPSQPPPILPIGQSSMNQRNLVKEEENSYRNHIDLKDADVDRYNDDADDDDDDDQDDYDYDYVCLESKKKLDDDDERIKHLLSKDSQFRYEDLVLKSSDNFLSLQTKIDAIQRQQQQNGSINQNDNDNLNQKIHKFYKMIILQALENFQQWSKFTIEIVKKEYKPEVYFNFVKHILLSGQNLLNIFKLAHRQLINNQPINGSTSAASAYLHETDVAKFSEQYLQCLKQLVLKTKRASTILAAESFQEMINSIKMASKIALEVKKFL